MQFIQSAIIRLELARPDAEIKNKRDLGTFISGLEETIAQIEEGTMTENDQVNRDVLKEFIELAKSITKVTDLERINILYSKYQQLRNGP